MHTGTTGITGPAGKSRLTDRLPVGKFFIAATRTKEAESGA